MQDAENIPIIEIRGDWIIYPFSHQEKIIESLSLNEQRQRELKLLEKNYRKKNPSGGPRGNDNCHFQRGE